MGKGNDYFFEILIVGVGKVASIDKFISTHTTQQEGHTQCIGLPQSECTLDIKGKKIDLLIWYAEDTDRGDPILMGRLGQKTVEKGVLLFYDITRRETMDTLNTRIDNIRKYMSEDVQMILLGTNCEMEDQRQVSTELGMQVAMEHGIKFMEVSAEHAIDVKQAFITLARDIMAAKKKKKKDAAKGRMSSGFKCNIL